MFNSLGRIFRVTTFGESHGPAIGCVVDGCPSGVAMDEQLLLRQLRRRRPGQSSISSARNEADEPEILSGILDGKTLGTPIAMLVRNKGHRPEEYDEIKEKPRVGHADEAWRDKFGHVDHRGGGRASGRETAARVMGGWVAECLLKQLFPEIEIVAYVRSVGGHALDENYISSAVTRETVERSTCRCPDPELAGKIESMLLRARDEGESYGGELGLIIRHAPPGLGEPVYAKAPALLSEALSSIGSAASVRWIQRPVDEAGSEFHSDNTYGGFNGGITNGEDIHIRIGFKPVSTIGGQARKGRHDPCVLPRVVPVAEAMAAMVLADLALLARVRTI